MSAAQRLSELVSQQAILRPDHIAFTTRSDVITYGALDRRTTQIAGVLQEHGAVIGDLVAICMHNCIELPIAVHGVLKSGAAYVPIDPSAPPERIADILRNGKIRYLLTHGAAAKALIPALALCPEMACIVGLGADGDNRLDWSDIEAHETSFAPVAPAAEDIAYVMFTSGSTGIPKGIVHTHASGLAYARASAHLYNYGPEDVIASSGPLHFDISTMPFLAGPFSGATSAIIPNAISKLPASLSQFIQDVGLTVLYTVPHLLIQMNEAGVVNERDLSRLRWVKFCGELFPPKNLEAVMDMLPDARFSNSYGPSEVNQCTYYHVAPGTRASDFGGQVPIGIPFGDSKCLVMDGDVPVQTGDVGELLVATSTMMKAYWENPKLNAMAFYHDPETGERFFRTRDAVYVEDGQLVMVGRIDRMVKMRGYRLELDEIEFQFLKYLNVHEVAVYPIMRDSLVIDIAASVLLKDPSETADLATAERMLRGHAQRYLPRYAVPRHIWINDTLFRNASGKIDRRALQEEAERKVLQT